MIDIKRNPLRVEEKFYLCDPRVLRFASNPGLKLANAFGVGISDACASELRGTLLALELAVMRPSALALLMFW